MAIVNLFGASCFQDISVFLNDTLVSSCSNYGYVAYLKSLLSYPLNYKNNGLRNSLYVFDEQANLLGDLNGSYKARKDWISASKLQEAIVPIFDDIFEIGKYIVPNVNLKLKLKRALPEFCLVTADTASATKYKIIIEECSLNLHKVDVNPSISSIHEKLYEKNEISYPFTKTVLRTANFSKGTVNATISNIFNSQVVPDLLCLTFVTTEAYNGKLTKNPFNFSRNGVTHVQIQVDKQPMDYLSLNVSDSEYLDAVDAISRNLSLGYESIGINRENWLKGNAVYVYKLYPSDGAGNLSIQITFADGAAENLTAIVLGQSHSILNLGVSGVSTSGFYHEFP